MPPVHPPPFRIVDCALVARVTGRSAQNLRELRDALLTIDAASMYNHFWGGLLRPSLDDHVFHNDFAVWARRALHDRILAERLAAVDPAEFTTLDELRDELVDICEDRLDETDLVPWARRGELFHFQSAQMVVFATGRELARPADLPAALPGFSRGSVFYHLVDARRRNADSADDLRHWLADLGPEFAGLVADLAQVDPLQGSLQDLKRRVVALVAAHFEGEAA